MTTINLESYVSPRLQELIQEANHSIQTVKEKILAAYNYAIETDKLTPKTAAKILREQLDFSDRYIREVLPLEAKELKFANKSITKSDNVEAEPVPPTIELQEQHKEDSGDNITEGYYTSDKVTIKTPSDNLKVNETTMVDTTLSSTDNNKEIENSNSDIISSTTTITTITTNDELDYQSASTSSLSKISEPNEFINQCDEIEILKQMLYDQRQENRYLVNEIRKLRNLDPQSVTVSREMEEIEDEKIRLSFQNDTKRIADEMDAEVMHDLILYDGDKCIQFIEHWNEMKRLFRELVEIDLYRKHKKYPDQNLSIQDAIYDVLMDIECDTMGFGKKLNFPDTLARYISEYFIDKKTEFYLRCKFGTSRINDDTLGFKEWRKELAKTPKQRKEDKKLFLEQSRENTKRCIEQLNQENEK